jgi:hypothetical protein
MILKVLKPKQALNKAFLKVKPGRTQIDHFKANLNKVLSQTNEFESEEFHKNLITDFLKKTWYDPGHFVNTKSRNDLVIHTGAHANTPVGVIIEVKKPTNKQEMISAGKLNVKAFQELILYYLRERVTLKNSEVKHLLVTNINEWYIVDASVFDRLFARNQNFVRLFNEFENGRLVDSKTDFFYKQIAEPFIETIESEIEFTFFDLRDYQKQILKDDKTGDHLLISLFKLLSPEHLLKLPFANDSNTLDRRFYSELLYIMGLKEVRQGNSRFIERNKPGDRNSGTILEDAILQLDNLEKLSRIDKPEKYGKSNDERLFNIALELTITWINRIIFLKLLEAQLMAFHQGDKSYAFLNTDKVKGYDDLNTLFFQVLAKDEKARNDDVKISFEKMPYLNSSLFEPTEIEQLTFFISNLKDDKEIPVFSQTVLRNQQGKKVAGRLKPLHYLFDFLNAYDFGSEGPEAIQEENKTLINASVLGLIFEKINGYKDGSFFTPGFITMYMCRETIRRAVVQKFNEIKKWSCNSIEELYDKIEDRSEANQIVNSIKICDPAVGSGHFLVSALNEMIAVKNDLRILQDREGRRLKEYQAMVVNDELIVTDEEGELFKYHPSAPESQRIQEALFHEKQTLIENCLFGVDINPNSVKICRLRLWIELLKNAYYKPVPAGRRVLETLPNIDINIKCGNSLVSRFPLDADLKQALKRSKWNINTYRIAVSTYRNAENKEHKREMERLILDIKQSFSTEIRMNDPLKKRLDKLAAELYHRFTGTFLFEPESSYGRDEKELEKKRHQEQEKLEIEIEQINEKMEEIKSSKVFSNSFEWRFEFPEVLNDDGDFTGFDVVIGNPPYFSLSKVKEFSDYYSRAGYQTYSKGADIYCLFYELAGKIVKPSGYLTYITSNSWLRAIYGESLKKYFLEHMRIHSLLNIEDVQVFDEATVESNVIMLQKETSIASFAAATLTKMDAKEISLGQFFQRNHFYFTPPSTNEWFLGNQSVVALKRKIENGSKLLKDFDIHINFGIKTGFNEAFIIGEKKREELIKADPGCTGVIKPVIRGRDLKKYSYKFSGQWAICTFPSLKFNIQDFPAIESHFLTIGKARLEQTGDTGCRKKTNNQWFETQDTISYWQDFEQEKIIWGEISDKPKFAFDDAGYYAEATTFIMTGEKLKFLLAILNSKVSEWYFHLIGTTTGMGTNRWKKYKIEMLPVKQSSETLENDIENIVNQILIKKANNPDADTVHLEYQIDRLVYKLYDLTDNEIKIIEEQ